MICPKCGSQNIEGSKFCIKCGNDLTLIQQNNSVDLASISNKQSLNLQQEQSIYNQNNNLNNDIQFQQNINNNLNQVESKKKIDIKKYIILIIIILVIIMLAFIIVKKLSSKAEYSIFDPDNLIAVKENGKYGFINSKGKMVISPQYDYAEDFIGNYAIVKLIKDNNKVYQVINSKGKVMVEVDSEKKIEYISNYNIWVVNGHLYNSNFKQLTEDAEDVEYVGDGYLSWINTNKKKAGIMKASGKKTFTRKYTSSGGFFEIETSSYGDLSEIYCRMEIGDQTGIVNCETGKIVYDFVNKNISNEYDNVFEIEKKDTHDFESFIYIHNNKVVYQTANESATFYFNGSYMKINDNNISYYDVNKDQLSTEQPNYDYSSDLSEWEQLNNLEISSCDNGHGLMKNEEVLLPCEWKEIKFFDINLYQYLKSKGKDYIITKDTDKYYVLNLKTKDPIIETNSRYISIDDDSTFISYEDKIANKYVIYNLLSGKSISIDNSLDSIRKLSVSSNYITIKENGKTNYYNTNLKLIYTTNE